MNTGYIIYTSFGIKLLDSSFTVVRSLGGAAAFEGGTTMPDSKEYAAWPWNRSSNIIAEADITNEAMTARSIAVGKYVRSVQADAVTGSVFVLEAFGDPNKDSSMSPILTKFDQTTMLSSAVVISSENGSVDLFYALDMKLDPSRRRLWIADAGNNRLIRANIDSLTLEREYVDDRMRCPFAMAVDESSGLVFVRALDAHSEGTSSSSSGSSSRERMETLIVFGDDGVHDVIAVPGDYAWLTDIHLVSPTVPYLKQMWRTDKPLPFPAWYSIQTDHFRRRVWWLSFPTERFLHMMDIPTMTVFPHNLASAMDDVSGLDVDLSSGKAYVCGKKGLGSVMIETDRSNFSILRTRVFPSYHVFGVSVEQGRQELLAFHWEGISAVTSRTAGESSSSSLSSRSSASSASVPNTSSMSSESSSQLNVVGSFDPDLIRSAPRTDEVPQTRTPSPLRSVPARIWSKDPMGVREVLVGTVKGTPNDSYMAATTAIRTPVFSWSASAARIDGVIVAFTAENRVARGEVNFSAGSMAVTHSIPNPLPSSVAAMSLPQDCGYLYASSGDKQVARIRFDIPSQPTEGDGSESAGSETMTVALSEENMEFRRMTCSWNAKSGLWSADAHEGRIVKVSSPENSPVFFHYGIVDSPFKIALSKQHNKFMIFGKHAVWTMDAGGGTVSSAYGVDDLTISDGAVSLYGHVGLALAQDGSAYSCTRIIGEDMLSVKASAMESRTPTKVAFDLAGRLFYSAETTNGRTSFRMIDPATGGPSQHSRLVEGSSVLMACDPTSGDVVSVMSTGTVLRVGKSYEAVSSTAGWNVAEIGFFGAPVSCASGVFRSRTTQITKQEAFRVFVGSAVDRSDRWDSGEIASEKTSIIYGGGDNLEPGCRYWANVAVKYSGLGWSKTQSVEFTVSVT